MNTRFYGIWMYLCTSDSFRSNSIIENNIYTYTSILMNDFAFKTNKLDTCFTHMTFYCLCIMKT